MYHISRIFVHLAKSSLPSIFNDFFDVIEH